jgi:hypothetical protein
MRVLLLGSLLLAACQSAVGPQGPAGEKGASGPTGAIGPTGAAGKDGTTPKIPHLIVAGTGEDLGPLTGEDTAIHPVMGIEIDWVGIPLIAYESTDCTGDGVFTLSPAGNYTLDHFPHRSTHFVSGLRHTVLAQQSPTKKTIMANSTEAPNYLRPCCEFQCLSLSNPSSRSGIPLIDTKMPATGFFHADLSIELR